MTQEHGLDTQDLVKAEFLSHLVTQLGEIITSDSILRSGS